MLGVLLFSMLRVMRGVISLLVVVIIYMIAAMARRQARMRLKIKADTPDGIGDLTRLKVIMFSGLIVNVVCYYLLYRSIYTVANMKINNVTIDDMSASSKFVINQVLSILAGLIAYSMDNKACGLVVAGLTGGIAAGKSSVAEILEEKGYRVICADRTYKELIKPDGALYDPLIDRFGSGILAKGKDSTMEISLEKLGQLVLSNQKDMDDLNRMTHPAILLDMVSKVWKATPFLWKPTSKCVLDVPLLFETKFLSYIACPIICVDAVEAARLKRFRSRETANLRNKKMARGQQMRVDENAVKNKFKQINDMQYNELERRANSDIIIDNNGTENNLKGEVQEKIVECTNKL